MRNTIIGFVLGMSVVSAGAMAGNPGVPPPARQLQPSERWEQDRGAALKQYQHNLETDALRNRPC